ncbi:MAG TPA: tRNA lysidine(34) synthetase TilS [Rhizomicrobium sp.]|nr:tRNA lysidine(34) synthetase TilS [Rhizomicrobium sp.]
MDAPRWPGAVAVSGGGDSMALMLLLKSWAKAAKLPPPIVLVVDHGLRKGSAADARKAVAWTRTSGLKAHLLPWKGAKPHADIEAGARAARYRLMGTWCQAHDIAFLYVAHTLEDQAETFMLRLARGSGIDGLSAMGAIAPYPLPGFDGLTLVRPLLEFPRADLRAFLKRRARAWLDDPMNEDPRFARVRLRRAAGSLSELGLSPERLAGAARHLARARRALEDATGAWLSAASRSQAGHVLLDGRALAEVPEEIGLRALARVLGAVSGQAYRPRFERLERLLAAISSGEFAARTLHGCRIGPAAKRDAIFGPGTLTIVREPGRKTERARSA